CISLLQSSWPSAFTSTLCLPAKSFSCAGALPTNEPSTYTSAPSGTDVTLIVPLSSALTAACSVSVRLGRSSLVDLPALSAPSACSAFSALPPLLELSTVIVSTLVGTYLRSSVATATGAPVAPRNASSTPR